MYLRFEDDRPLISGNAARLGRGVSPLQGCDGLSAWRSQACSPGYHVSGLQPGGGRRRRAYAGMAARHASPGLQPEVSCLGLSARRGQEAGDAIPGRQPGVLCLGLSARRGQRSGRCDPRPAAWGIISRAFSPARQRSGGCDPGPAARGIISRAFSPAGAGGGALTPGWLLGMRSRACSPGYHISGFQPGGGREAGVSRMKP